MTTGLRGREADAGELSFRPANEASWDDLQAILTGSAGTCQCTRERLGDHDFFRTERPEREAMLRAESHCGDPRATETIGVVAYLDGEPVGWVAVDRRAVYGRVLGSPVPWLGRNEKKDDESVWAIPCLVVRRGFRGRGYTAPLVQAAVEHARRHGAAAVEGYPMLPTGRELSWNSEFRVGPVSAFAAAGFTEVTRPTKRRVVMRLEL
jgi:GNAT superfamily N-acetyltransferase